LQSEPSDARAPQIQGHPELLADEAPASKIPLCSSHIFLRTISTSLQYPLSVIIAQWYGHHSYNEVAIVFSAQEAPM
jgi:hypothetical protein